MVKPVLFTMHLGIAEAGKVHALAGRHSEALRHYREAIRLAVAAKAPEIFFRHYSQCVLESLEKSGGDADIIAYCEAAETHYASLDADTPLHRKDRGATLERLDGVLVIRGHEHDLRARTGLRGGSRHFQPGEAGHADVEEGDVRRVLGQGFDRAGAVLAFGQHVQLRPGEAQLVDERLPQQGFVFGNDAGAHGLRHRDHSGWRSSGLQWQRPTAPSWSRQHRSGSWR